MGCGCLVVVKNKMLEGLMWEVAGVFLGALRFSRTIPLYNFS